ncbi:MAG: methyltransferase domain-containing protein [Alistipes sp.]
MKKLIRWALNHLPRTFLQRIAGLLIPLAGCFYRGKGRMCPICDHSFRKFLPYGYVVSRENALCPTCLSLERHRLLYLFLQRQTTLFTLHPRLLHIAPEVCLMKQLKKQYKGSVDQYLTADLESPLADLHFDIQQIPLPDNSFDVIFCNHILEHVIDDQLALRELYRILRIGGWGILLSPVDLDRAKTYEDDTITDPAERTRIFGQYDHRRIYGQDYSDRLRSAGFQVEDIDFAQTLTAEERHRYALPNDHIYLVHKNK